MANRYPLLYFNVALELRSLRFTIITRFIATTDLSAILPQPGLFLADFRLGSRFPQRRASMLTRFSFAHMSTPLPRRPAPVRMLLASRVNCGLRPSLAGSTLTLTFSRPARRSFIFQPVCSLIPVTGPFAPEASTAAVTSNDLSGCFRLEQQLPGGISSSHWSNAPFSWRTKDSGKKNRLMIQPKIALAGLRGAKIARILVV